MDESRADDQQLIWDTALLWVVVVVGSIGALMVLARRTTARAFELLVFGGAESVVSDGAEDYVSFVYAVLGAVMIGWMTALAPIVRGPLRRREPWAWSTVTTSLVVWFAIDSTISVTAGFAENALLNLAFVTAFAVPLAMIRPHLRPAPYARLGA